LDPRDFLKAKMAEEENQKGKFNKGKGGDKISPAQVFAEDMSEEWSKDAVKAARDAFALTIASGDVHSTIADFIRKKFDRDHERGWNCIVGLRAALEVVTNVHTMRGWQVQQQRTLPSPFAGAAAQAHNRIYA
jgi:hypothetical protein